MYIKQKSSNLYSFPNLRLIAFSVLINTIIKLTIIKPIPIIIPGNGPVISVNPKTDSKTKIIPDLIISLPE